ncbi:hypothetical protein ACFOJ6_05450 [Gordonia humi]|uniref:hypothetical protein n=1 Tax=Gordonia humi TaxID=686429 RepID=UPI003618F149
MTFASAGTVTDPMRASVVVVRKKPITGESMRTTSSKADRTRVGSARSIAHWSGCSMNLRIAKPSALTVVSTPAVRNDRTSIPACSSLTVPVSAAS